MKMFRSVLGFQGRQASLVRPSAVTSCCFAVYSKRRLIRDSRHRTQTATALPALPTRTFQSFTRARQPQADWSRTATSQAESSALVQDDHGALSENMWGANFFLALPNFSQKQLACRASWPQLVSRKCHATHLAVSHQCSASLNKIMLSCMTGQCLMHA